MSAPSTMAGDPGSIASARVTARPETFSRSPPSPRSWPAASLAKVVRCVPSCLPRRHGLDAAACCACAPCSPRVARPLSAPLPPRPLTELHASLQAASPGLIRGAEPPPTSAEFQAVVASVKHAVAEGIQPVRIAKGSSGSYFARDENKVCVAVFKPKDEEPYGRLNPKVR
jgi:hypothetical protein